MTLDTWPGYLEIFKAEGMDFAVLDAEHGSVSLERMEELCRTARLLDFPLLVRPESCSFHLIRKVLDMGPAGLMLPWVERDEQLDQVEQALFVPPKGRRGPGGPSVMAARSFDRQGWAEIEESLFVMMQVESPAGLANASRLAARPWVDAVMLGPYDFSANLGLCGQMDHPAVVEAIEKTREEAAKAGKPCGMVVGTVDHGKFWMERGFHFLITSEITALARQKVSELARGLRAGVGR